MIPNIHQSVDEIIKSSSPEQRILWQQIRLLTGENAAIRQMYYNGPIAGSEFITYQAGKIYVAYQMGAFQSGLVFYGASTSYVNLNDENNVLFNVLANEIMIWDATAAAPKIISLPAFQNNFYFSSISGQSAYTFMKFIGYKINFG